MQRTPTTRVALTLGLLLLSASSVLAQRIAVPWVSPHARVMQTIGLTEVTIDYHRPGVKGREIWGGLVAYNEVWRAGANDNTTIAFTHPVRIEGKDLAAGTYGLHMIPTPRTWTLIFSRNATSWGSFHYREEEDALRVTVMPEKSDFTEWLSYGFDQVDHGSALAQLEWAELRVPFKIEVDTDAVVIANARNELRHLAGFSWQSWSHASSYLLGRGVELEQALEWADRSIGIQSNFTNQHVRSQILRAMGREEDAARAEAQAMAAATTEQDVNALGYAYLQRDDVDKAIEVFQKNVKEHPRSWNVHDSLGEAYATKGDTAKAIKSYTKALEMAPETQKQRIERTLERLKGEKRS